MLLDTFVVVLFSFGSPECVFRGGGVMWPLGRFLHHSYLGEEEIVTFQEEFMVTAR